MTVESGYEAAPPPAAPEAVNDAELMREEEVLACSFDNWYTRFKDVTLRSSVIPLPEDIVSFLLADGISMPANAVRGDGGDSDDEWGDGGGDSDSEDDHNDRGNSNIEVASFPDIQRKVDEAIASLGGSVLPKLNWSAPKDARWIQSTSAFLQCENAIEVFTLLKASDFVAHDLCHSFDHCLGSRRRPDSFSLVLRKWYNLDDSGEFRCFVQNGQLLAVSQRHTSVYFPHLSEAEFMDEVLAKLGEFFKKHIEGVFPSERYVFDVFIGKPPRRKVSLIDFSPWGATTDPLMFDWEELQKISSSTDAQLPVVKTVKSESDIRAKIENYHALPLEVAQMGATSSADIEALCRRAQDGISTQQS